MLLSQRNELFEIVRRSGLHPGDFEWQPVLDIYGVPGGEQLVHQSGYWFGVEDRGARGFHVRYSPGRQTLEAEDEFSRWESAADEFAEWVTYLQREIGQPNLWAELAAGEPPREIGAATDVANTPFLPGELERIDQQLDELKEFIRTTHALDAAQYQELAGRLDYLKAAARRVPRLDWRNALLGVLLTTVTQGLLPAEPVKDAITFTLRGLGALFGHPMPELPS